MEPTGKKEGVMKYCCKCPYYKLHFRFDEPELSWTAGWVQGRCWKKDEVYGFSATHMRFYGVEMGDELKRKVFLSEVRFRYNDVPKELSEKVKKYIDDRDCVIPIEDKDCIFHAERNLEEWNKES